LRFDEEERLLHVFTASPAMMRRWIKRGVPLTVTSRSRQGEPQGWSAVVPLACLRPLRALGAGGEIVRKRRGAAFGARKLARSGEAKAAG
jgi:hypothetical protein